MENQVQETGLKAGAISKGEVTLVAVAGAAPVMCIGGSMHTFLSQTGTGISLAALFATIFCIFIGLSYDSLSEKYNNCGGTYSYITEIFGKKLVCGLLASPQSKPPNSSLPAMLLLPMLICLVTLLARPSFPSALCWQNWPADLLSAP